MSRSCQSTTFSRPTGAAARTTRDSPEMRSATFGLRLCGIADDPFIPAANGSSASPTSVRARCLTSVAKRSSEAAQSASAQSSSAWRSREITCVDTGSGSSPSRAHAISSTCGSIAPYAPTVPDSWPTRHVSSACSSRRRRAIELERPAGELPAERRRLGVDPVRASDADRPPVLESAADHRRDRPLDSGDQECSTVADLEGQRRVEHVGGRQPVVHPAGLGAELLADRVDERREVVVGRPLELRDPFGSRRRRALADRPRRRRPAPRRARPSRRAQRARPPATARACPPPTRCETSPDASSGRSLRPV